MIHLSWASLYEGNTDEAYLDVLIPRLMEEIILRHGIGRSTIPEGPAVLFSRGSVAHVAQQACEARDAFFLCFIHADTGGRNLEAVIEGRSCAYCDEMKALCDLPPVRCIVIAPRKETEAWILADPTTLSSVLGHSGSPHSIGLPADAGAAERLLDPKQVLESAIREVRRGRRLPRVTQVAPVIAQRQSLDALRRSRSFADFEASLRAALVDLGCVAG
jgi:hypothetical protein